MGSGPGGLQVSYALRRLGLRHAVISADPSAGGMFRRFPFFQRMLSWTKPYAPIDRRSREYERYDWNSLIADEEEHRALMPSLMDGSSYFPSRPEMERNLALFAERADVPVRYGCRWESTRREGDGFVLATSDGEYRCAVAVFAVGVAEPSRPDTPGIENAPHYAETRAAETYAGRRVFIIGKENSAFELASGLLPWARRIVLASPSPAKLSVITNSLVGVRARYVQPYEDHLLGGGVVVLDAAIQEIARAGGGLQVRVRASNASEERTFDADDVIAATGWVAPLRDLPALGVATFGRSRLPAQTPFWESASVPGIYFAGTITQASAGLKKNGIPSNSGGVNGHRYNGRVLARHIAERHFGAALERPLLRPDELASFLVGELTHSPELWHQRSYLARAVTAGAHGLRDEGIVPLAHFVDAAGPDGVAVAIEANASGENYPAVYLRRDGRISERLLPPDPLLDFSGARQREELEAALGEL
ncbi:MAG: NAD(P)-binding domain-containing protein, partial [Candidatus Limnocylindria bacterium]